MCLGSTSARAEGHEEKYISYFSCKFPDECLTDSSTKRWLLEYMHFFITGTDTHVGKTHLTRLMVSTLRADGHDAYGFKPISCGDREDGNILAEVSGNLALEVVNPLHFSAALAPYVAALLENSEIEPREIVESFHAFSKNKHIVLVEGAGGWEVPITENYAISDLAKDLALPVILVAANRLGALNHILLTLSAIKAKGLHCAGIILNQLEDEMDTPMITNKGILTTLTDVPVLDHVIFGQDFLSPELIDILTA